MDRNLGNLIGKNIVVYDLEIKKTIQECGGWDHHEKMGISVGCAFDYRSMRYRVFMDDNLPELVNRLNEPDTLVVAFNNIGFDNKLLRATTLAEHQKKNGPGALPESDEVLKPDDQLNNYDMLLVSRKGAGVQSNFIPGFKLDDHLQTLRLPMKTGEGALAPVWWQEGKVGKVIDYCMNDVTQEKALFEYMFLTGLCGSKYKNSYEIELPKFN